jgi:peptide/nickel transport system substrate-binding protein
MHRTRLFLLLLAVQSTIFIVLTSTCGSQDWEIPKPRGTLKIVDLFEPYVSINLMYSDFLIRKDKDNKFVPSLAENWRWVNDRTIEFKLRRGVIFHNGEQLNSEAVRVNWEAYRIMKSPSPFRFLNIPDETAFEIIDKYEVRFTLPEPDGLAYAKFWLFDLFAPAFFSEHSFKENNWSQLEKPGLWGAGPFMLVEGSADYTRSGDRVVLEAFEDYWDPRYPKVRQVIFENMLLGDRKEAMRLCRETEGAVDIVTRIRPLDTLKVAESPFAEVVKSKDETLFFCWFNQRKKNSKWRDIRLRKAINYAINRKELWKSAAKGNAYNLGGWIPEGTYGHNPSLELFTHDTTKARSLLAEAGYSNGFQVKVIASEEFRVEAQIMARMLERIGLKVHFDILTKPQFWRATYIPFLEGPPEKQDWDFALLGETQWTGHAEATFLLYGFLDISDTRWIEYDPVYEANWKDMINTVDSAVREEKMRQIVQYIYERAYALFIYSPLSLYAINKGVHFVPYKDGYLNLRETSVTENHWSIRGKNN